MARVGAHLDLLALLVVHVDLADRLRLDSQIGEIAGELEGQVGLAGELELGRAELLAKLLSHGVELPEHDSGVVVCVGVLEHHVVLVSLLSVVLDEGEHVCPGAVLEEAAVGAVVGLVLAEHASSLPSRDEVEEAEEAHHVQDPHKDQ